MKERTYPTAGEMTKVADVRPGEVFEWEDTVYLRTTGECRPTSHNVPVVVLETGRECHFFESQTVVKLLPDASFCRRSTS